MKDLMQKGYEPLFVNGFGMFFGGLLALITSFFYEQWWVQAPVYQVMPFIKLTVLIVIVCNLLFYNLYGYLLRFYSATLLSFAGAMTPFLVGVMDMILLHQVPHWSFFGATVIVGFGLYLFYRDELRGMRRN